MKINKKLALFSVIVFLIAVPDFAQTQKSSFFIGFGSALPQNEAFSSAFETDFGFSLAVTKKIELTLGFCHWKSRVEERPSGLLNGDLTMTPFLGGVRFNLLPDRAIEPYVCLGIAYAVSTFRMGDVFTIPESTLTQKLKNGIGFQGGGGLQLKIAPSFKMFIEGAYIIRSTTGVTTIADLNLGVRKEEFSIGLNSLILQVGIKYFVNL